MVDISSYLSSNIFFSASYARFYSYRRKVLHGMRLAQVWFSAVRFTSVCSLSFPPTFLMDFAMWFVLRKSVSMQCAYTESLRHNIQPYTHIPTRITGEYFSGYAFHPPTQCSPFSTIVRELSPPSSSSVTALLFYGTFSWASLYN